MLFSRVSSFLLFIFSLGILAVAKPVELDSRASAADLQNVVATLKSKTDSIVPQIKSAAANPHISANTVTPLINELITALNTAQNSISRVQIRDLDELEKRQNQQVVAQQFAAVVQDIAGAVHLLPKGLPGLAGLLLSLDLAIAAVLRGLDFVVIGLGILVGGLLRGVAGLLAGLGFGLTLGLLGL